MKANPLAAAALVTALVVTSSAYAEEVLVTYTGIIQSGIDYAGIFGAAGASLTRDAFVVQYVIDPSLGLQTGGPGYNFEQAEGGTQAVGPPGPTELPVISATLTINGETYTFPNPGAYGNVYGENDTVPGPASQQSHTVSSQLTEGGVLHSWFMSNYIQTYSTNPIPKTLTTPFTYTAMPGDGTGGQWYLNQYQDPSNPALSLYDAEGVFDSVTITVGSIPEPTTWAMMLIGFVGLGIAGYRRTRKLVLVAA